MNPKPLGVPVVSVIRSQYTNEPIFLEADGELLLFSEFALSLFLSEGYSLYDPYEEREINTIESDEI